jgi:serine/threonine-protein kinase
VKPTAGLTDSSLATAAGLTPGTPAYMAPEVALGEHADGRADLYALGCVAYYLLTGKLVFEADNLFQMVVKHLQDEPEPPSRRTSLPVPAQLDAVVLACLVKSREDRIRSAGELRRALAGVGLPAWGSDQAAQWWLSAAEPPSHRAATPA